MFFDISLGSFQHFQRAIAVVCMSIVAIFLVNLYKARLRFIKLKKQGLVRTCQRSQHMTLFTQYPDNPQCMPPHHPLFGHLLLAKDLLSKIPPDSHPSYLPGLIRRAVPDIGPVFYLDMWPFALPILVVSSPSAAYQITQEHSLPKSGELRRWIRPLAGNKDLVSLEGQPWKKWRNINNPGFSASHLMSLTPQILREVLTFCEILRERAQAGVAMPLEEATVNLTMDTIGRVIL